MNLWLNEKYVTTVCRSPPPVIRCSVSPLEKSPGYSRKIPQTLKLSVVTRSNFSRTDTQEWFTSGSNVPVTDTDDLEASDDLQPEEAILYMF
jgi:hypothetical protein